ncbi:uncharacterized protein [Onthophagus taurus]|uniref:uncharacterized protein n=1 Tax=Onthophagus taurus TaxID=166361 RepID=UPI0039BDB40D
MAIVVAWVQNWVVLAISLSALLAVMGFLAFCICLGYNKKRFQNIYILNKTLSVFSITRSKNGYMQPKNDTHRVEDVRRISRALEPEEVDTRSFDQLQLVIEDANVDTVSCISEQSLPSFLSAQN